MLLLDGILASYDGTYILDKRTALCCNYFFTKWMQNAKCKRIGKFTWFYKRIEADRAPEFSAQNYPTMSLVVPIVRGLQYAIRFQQMNTTEGECLRSSLLEVIWRRFKKIAFGNETKASNAQKWLPEAVTALIQRNRRDSTVPVIELPVDKSKFSLWTLLDQKLFAITPLVLIQILL